MKRRWIVSACLSACLPFAALAAGDREDPTDALSVPSDAERARWTMADMRSLATAIEEYAIDNKAYPSAASIKELQPFLQPAYIRQAPSRDGWGTSLRYQVAADRKGYVIVSAGADRKFDEPSWKREGQDLAFGEDAVLASGAFTRSWQLFDPEAEAGSVPE